tara:strand:+ start:10206 stop:10409 length:204 start_codon:yes stop_codon:yes gene_type:complete
MKTLVTLTVGTLLFVASGCTSTVTLGPSANKDGVVGLSAGQSGASVTLPLIKAETSPNTTEETTKKK